MKLCWRGPLYLAILAAAVLLPLVASQHQQSARGQQASPTTTASAPNAMAVDAVAGGVIDSTAAITGTAPFEINIVIASAPTPYQGYQYRLEWDPAVLTANSAAELKPADLPSCTKAIPSESSIWGSCARTDSGTQFVGPVTKVSLRCIADGVSPLHLATTAQDPLGTATYELLGGNLDTTLSDASVTCLDVGPPAPAAAPPANDDFANAKPVPSLPLRDGVSTASATQELFELDSCFMGDHTVWYSFTPDSTQFVQADTLGSDFDTVLVVYTGASFASPTFVGCNDDTDGLQSTVTAKLEAGQPYYFQVGGFYGYKGSLVFHLEGVPPPPSPMPNAFAVDAISGGGVDPTRMVAGVTPFDVDINITSASEPYQGYQYVLQWDPAVLAYDGQTDLTPADLSLCATPATTTATVSSACARVSGETQFAGPVNTVTFHCVADGTSLLHLMTRAEDPLFGTETIGSGGTDMDTVLTDASITCRGTGRAAPSAVPTPRPVAPVTGTGGFLEER